MAAKFLSYATNSWNLVKEGGSLIISLRLTEQNTIDDIKKSYQFINYSGTDSGEIAPYVVLNAEEIIAKFYDLGIRDIRGYGFYGNPSESAVTPYDKVCFTVFLLTKTNNNNYFYDVDMPIKISNRK